MSGTVMGRSHSYASRTLMVSQLVVAKAELVAAHWSGVADYST